tara:strand:- start:825 stop:1370 length:546 start_codon:yes stop_codon:yes gene_type:complete
MAIIEAIETVYLEANVLSVTFSAISGYEHLELAVSIRGGRTNSTTYTQMVLNADTGSNYSERRIHTSGTNMYGQSYASNAVMFKYQNTTPALNYEDAGQYAYGRITIYDYLNANKNTTVSSDWSAQLNSPPTYGNCDRTVQVWDNTAAVTSITMQMDLETATDPYPTVRGSTITLYGIKSA